jgi:hypothetical protein
MNQDGLKGLNVPPADYRTENAFYRLTYRYAEHLVGFVSTNLIGSIKILSKSKGLMFQTRRHPL